MSGGRRMSGSSETVPTHETVVVLTAAVVLYSLFIAEAPLLAVLAVGSVGLVYGGLVVRRIVPWPAGSSYERYLKPITGVLTAGVLLYGLVIAEAFLFALLAVATIGSVYAAWRITYAVWHYRQRPNV